MINDVCKAIGLPGDTFDTLRGESDSLAGLVLEIAGEFPQVNEEVTSGAFIFIPLEINKNRLDKIKVTIKEQTPPKKTSMMKRKILLGRPLVFCALPVACLLVLVCLCWLHVIQPTLQKNGLL